MEQSDEVDLQYFHVVKSPRISLPPIKVDTGARESIITESMFLSFGQTGIWCASYAELYWGRYFGVGLCSDSSIL